MENGGSSLRRRSPTADDKVDSPNLRDFLRVKDDDADRNLAGVSLNTVLGQDGRPLPVNRTLLDIIRDDPYATKESKKSWKVFRDKLRLRRAGAAWTSSVHIPTSDVPIAQNPNRMISRRNSTRTFSPRINSEYPNPESSFNNRTFNSTPSNRSMLRRNSSRLPSPSVTANRHTSEGSASFNTSQINNVGVRIQEEEEGQGEEDEAEEEEEEEGGGGEPAVKMSLMALLAETDREMGLDGCTSFMASDDDDDDDDDEDEEESSSVGYNNCCVCMVRHKGAALIPCGHTFCRMCSRELWVQRGNCPLCNGFILEILHIF